MKLKELPIYFVEYFQCDPDKISELKSLINKNNKITWGKWFNKSSSETREYFIRAIFNLEEKDFSAFMKLFDLILPTEIIRADAASFALNELFNKIIKIHVQSLEQKNRETSLLISYLIAKLLIEVLPSFFNEDKEKELVIKCQNHFEKLVETLVTLCRPHMAFMQIQRRSNPDMEKHEDNGLYRAIAHLIARDEDELENDFRSFVTEKLKDVKVDRELYINSLICQYEYNSASEKSLSLLMDYLQRPIYMINNHGNLVSPKKQKSNWKNDPIFLYHDDNGNDRKYQKHHYDGLVPKQLYVESLSPNTQLAYLQQQQTIFHKKPIIKYLRLLLSSKKINDQIKFGLVSRMEKYLVYTKIVKELNITSSKLRAAKLVDVKKALFYSFKKLDKGLLSIIIQPHSEEEIKNDENILGQINDECVNEKEARLKEKIFQWLSFFITNWQEQENPSSFHDATCELSELYKEMKENNDEQNPTVLENFEVNVGKVTWLDYTNLVKRLIKSYAEQVLALNNNNGYFRASSIPNVLESFSSATDEFIEKIELYINDNPSKESLLTYIKKEIDNVHDAIEIAVEKMGILMQTRRENEKLAETNRKKIIVNYVAKLPERSLPSDLTRFCYQKILLSAESGLTSFASLNLSEVYFPSINDPKVELSSLEWLRQYKIDLLQKKTITSVEFASLQKKYFSFVSLLHRLVPEQINLNDDIDIQFSDLMNAIEVGNVCVVDSWLSRGPLTPEKREIAQTLLHAAIEKDQLQIVKNLLSTSGVDPLEKKDSKTALVLAGNKSGTEFLEAVFENIRSTSYNKDGEDLEYAEVIQKLRESKDILDSYGQIVQERKKRNTLIRFLGDIQRNLSIRLQELGDYHIALREAKEQQSLDIFLEKVSSGSIAAPRGLLRKSKLHDSLKNFVANYNTEHLINKLKQQQTEINNLRAALMEKNKDKEESDRELKETLNEISLVYEEKLEEVQVETGKRLEEIQVETDKKFEAQKNFFMNLIYNLNNPNYGKQDKKHSEQDKKTFVNTAKPKVEQESLSTADLIFKSAARSSPLYTVSEPTLDTQTPGESIEESLEKKRVRLFFSERWATLQHQIVVDETVQNLSDKVSQFGYYLQDVDHDGNCFFSAAAAQLHGINHESLRELLVNHIVEQFDLYAHIFVDRDPNEVVENYRKLGEWADHEAVAALSRVMNMNVVIVYASDSPTYIIRQSEPLGTIYLGYEPGRHYQVMIRNPDLIPLPGYDLEQIMLTKEIDTYESILPQDKCRMQLRS